MTLTIFVFVVVSKVLQERHIFIGQLKRGSQGVIRKVRKDALRVVSLNKSTLGYYHLWSILSAKFFFVHNCYF